MRKSANEQAILQALRQMFEQYIEEDANGLTYLRVPVEIMVDPRCETADYLAKKVILVLEKNMLAKEERVETYKLNVLCENCKTTFPLEIEKGKKFGQDAYFPSQEPLVCPNCGVKECAKHTYVGDTYGFNNFLNRGAGGGTEPALERNH